MSKTNLKPTSHQLKLGLTDLQYQVTQHGATEPPFNNEYWDHYQDGIYVDIVSGEPLFSSKDKYDAGCGWPSFTKPIIKTVIRPQPDNKLPLPRVEVRSRRANSHLGHVFTDHSVTTGTYYCINSAALRFIPVDRLQIEGYGEYQNLFSTK